MAIAYGSEGTKVLGELARTLRDRTRRRAEELDGQRYDHYTPWLCLRPVLNAPLDENVSKMPFTSGELITDSVRLSAIDALLGGQGDLIVRDMPVSYADWPVMDDIAEQRPDAIAAFHEGRVLLSASSFLNDNYETLVDFVVPQRRDRPSGFDSALARGAVFRTFPPGRSGLLAGFQLAHAMGHQAALLFQSADPIFSEDRFELVDYKVRNDQRSADHAFVSTVALAYMVILSNAIYGKVAVPCIADDHVSGYGTPLSSALDDAIESIRSTTDLTDFGREVLSDLRCLI